MDVWGLNPAQAAGFYIQDGRGRGGRHCGGMGEAGNIHVCVCVYVCVCVTIKGVLFFKRESQLLRLYSADGR